MKLTELMLADSQAEWPQLSALVSFELLWEPRGQNLTYWSYLAAQEPCC